MAIMKPEALVEALTNCQKSGVGNRIGRCWHEAPFDKNGNQVSYHDKWSTTLRKVENFEDTATFLRFERGRSAAHSIWQRSDGTTFVMFLGDLQTAIRCCRDGRLEGIFTYVKRGQNYGVAYA